MAGVRDEKKGQAASQETHETPKPNEKSAMDAGGDKSAVKQQKMDHATDNGEGSNAPLDGKVVGSDSAVRKQVDLPELPDTSLTVVEENVYEKFFAENSPHTPLYRLRFARGQVVRSSEYRAVTETQEGPAMLSRGGSVAYEGVVGDVTRQVGGAEGQVGGTVEPAGPAKAAQKK